MKKFKTFELGFLARDWKSEKHIYNSDRKKTYSELMKLGEQIHGCVCLVQYHREVKK